MLGIQKVEELTLSANQDLESASRLQWRTKEGVTPESKMCLHLTFSVFFHILREKVLTQVTFWLGSLK